jgi:hypothetical protein
MEAGIAAVGGEAGIAVEVAEGAEVIRRVAAAAVVDIPPAVAVAAEDIPPAVAEVAATVEVSVRGGDGKKPHFSQNTREMGHPPDVRRLL